MNQREPIRVVIGAGEAERLPAKVCEWSIRRRTWREVEVIHTFDRQRPGPRWKLPTAFSLVRWWIPELLAKAGRAIYVDSDMLVFADLAELWDYPMGEKALRKTPRPDVLVIDCGRCGRFWSMQALVDELDRNPSYYGRWYQNLGFVPPDQVGSIPAEWDHLDAFEAGRTKLLHYTDLHRQPWKKTGHPWGHLWYEAAHETIRTGAAPAEWLEDLPEDVQYAVLRAQDRRQAPAQALLEH